jgi:beta-barrel assembly-enhancing protease
MKKTSKITRMILYGFISMILLSCSKSGSDTPITIFTVEDDISLGLQIDQEIIGKVKEYPVLDSVKYAAAYAHLYRIRDNILASGKLTYAKTFAWKCRIIQNDSVVNAFCVPGGNIYVYSGIIKLLDNEAEFAGVLGHEMAHADLRHTSEQLTLVYGENLLLSLILGNNPSQIAEITAGLAQGLGNLAYSRSHEYEADEYAVRYLYPTQYDAASIGDFFVKIAGQPTPPAFLSDHPSPSDRLAKINEVFSSLGGVHGQTFPDRYLQFKATLP